MANDSPTATPWQIDRVGYPSGGSLNERVRFLLGYAPAEKHHTPRRAIEEVLV